MRRPIVLILIMIIVVSCSQCYSILGILKASGNPSSFKSDIPYKIKISGHPRLFFTKRDLPAIKEKINADNITKALYARLIAQCEKYVISELPAPRSSGWCRYLRGARDAVIQMEQCALAYLLTGNRDFLERARAVIRTVLRWDRWVDPDHEGPGVQSDLMTAEISRGLAIAYDWLYDALTPEELRAIREALLKRAASRIYANSKSGIWWATERGHHSNWCGVLHGGLGLAGLALLGEEPDAPLWIERAKEQIIAFLNAGGIDGGWAEGLGYWAYGVGYAVLFIDALRRVTGEDLYVHPYLKKTPYFPVYAVMPDFSGYVNFADSWYGGVRGLVSLLFRLSSEYKNPYSQWTALKILELRGSDTSSLHWNLLWYDPSLKPKSPSGSLPSSKVFRGIRWVIIRTGWNESDMLLATKGGTNTEPHRHFDCGSFVLNCFGERLVTDPGAGTYSKWYWTGVDYHVATIGHSTLLVNGEGQTKSPEPGAVIRDWLFSGWFNYVELELAPVYTRLLSARRAFVVFGKPPMIIIFDAITPRWPNVKIEWLLHFMGDVRIEHGSIKIDMDDARLIVQPLTKLRGGISINSGEGDKYLRFEIGLNNAILLYPVSLKWDVVPEVPPFRTYQHDASILIELNRSLSTDYVLFNPSGDFISDFNEIKTDGYLCVLTESYRGEIERLALISGKTLIYRDHYLVNSNTPISIVIEKSSKGMRGIIRLNSSSEISLKEFIPLNALKVNGSMDYPYTLRDGFLKVQFPKGMHLIDLIPEKMTAETEIERRAKKLLSDVLSLVYWSELRFKDSEFSGKIKEAITHYKAAVMAYVSGNPESCIGDALKAATIIRDVYLAEEKRLQQYHLMILAIQLVLTVFLCSITSLAFYKWGLPVCRRLWTKLRKKPP
ncbi:MAG: DUF4962 domain-containing protein, partial [Thermoprotei archaeon]|nr:DUF4962 domain-containing protein [Thermoprotei archaeon]